MDDPGSIPLFSIVLYFLLVVGCGYFAGAETSLASVNRIRMMSLCDKGDRRAKKVLFILDNFEEALSVLLIGNNVMNIGCATLAVVIATKALGSGSVVVTVTTLITTVIVYLFGEILPKSFARSCNEKFAMAISGSLCVLMKLLKPLSVFFAGISKAATKPFVSHIEPEKTVTEDELYDIVDNIKNEDDFDEDTSRLMKSALDFDDRTAREVMIPWEKVQTVSMGMKTGQILDIIRETSHSRLPVIGRDGTVRGIIQIRNFLRAYIKNKNRVILASVTDYPYFTKPDIRLDDLLSLMSNHRRNLAFVKNDDGKVIGIITVEDILETLVGEIYDEEDIGGGSDE